MKTGSKIIRGSISKNMTPNFIVVINVLLPICCHIDSGMPYLRIFVEDVFELLDVLNVFLAFFASSFRVTEED